VNNNGKNYTFGKTHVKNQCFLTGIPLPLEYRGLHLIFYCESKNRWCVGSSARWKQEQSRGDCSDTSDVLWACLDKGVDLFQGHPEFNPLWHSDADQPPEAKPYVKSARKPVGKGSRWNSDNYIVLDVDEVAGHGPETITFNNVPPGTYQIAANIFSAPMSSYPDIRKGNPRMNIIIGSRNVQFHCEISKACDRVSRIWSVANIRIVDAGEEYEDGQPTGKHRYFIRLLDSKETVAKLDAAGLGTTQTQSTANYFTISPEMDYNDAQLEQACIGECKPSKGSEGYETCLEKPPR